MKNAGQWEWRFAIDDATAAGHFPGHPIIPGALLLDTVLRGLERELGTTFPNVQVRQAKFLRPVRPGDAVTVKWQIKPSGSLEFDCLLDGAIALRGSFAGLAP